MTKPPPQDGAAPPSHTAASNPPAKKKTSSEQAEELRTRIDELHLEFSKVPIFKGKKNKTEALGQGAAARP